MTLNLVSGHVCRRDCFVVTHQIFEDDDEGRGRFAPLHPGVAPSLSGVRHAHYFLPAQTSCAIPWRANTRSTAPTTSETEIRFIQRKSIGHSRRKQGLHST